MQKTEIKYYCDVCRLECEKRVVTFTYDIKFSYLHRHTNRWRTCDVPTEETMHLCQKCAEPILKFFNLEMMQTQAILEEETANA